MRNFTPDEMAELKQFEGHLATAFRMGFKRPSPIADNEKVADILAAAGGVYPRNWNCSHCLYKVWYEAGKNYFKTLEELKKAEEEPKKLTASERMKAFWAKRKENGNAEGASEKD